MALCGIQGSHALFLNLIILFNVMFLWCFLFKCMCLMFAWIKMNEWMNCFSSSCVPKLPVSLDCTFLIAPSVFSNNYLNTSGRRYIYKSSSSCFLKSGLRCSSVTHYVSGVYPIYTLVTLRMKKWSAWSFEKWSEWSWSEFIILRFSEVLP